MTSSKSQNMHDLLNEYFTHRREKLNSLSMEELLASANANMLCLNHVIQADRVVETLIHEALLPFENALLAQLLNKLRRAIIPGESDAYAKLLQNCPGTQDIAYANTFAKVSNRLCRSFLREFAFADGSIDWQALDYRSRNAKERRKGEVPSGL